MTERARVPLISILMAVYEPRMDWLGEQLDSLERQDYPNLRLYIRDDCSGTLPLDRLEECVGARIRSFPFVIRRNEENLGSNLTFERLTREAEGDFFAYCDQDDVWLPEKLSTLQAAMAREDALLACSDMFIIDENGKQVADSITRVRRHHVFKSGEGLAPGLLTSNFVTGCTTLVAAGQARAAVPFCPYMVHDHYLALWCAENGRLLSLPQRLIRYRIHSNNQTTILTGVTDKRSYVDERIRGRIDRLQWLGERFGAQSDLSGAIQSALAWTRARARYFDAEAGAWREIWKYRALSPATSAFEIVMARAPDWLFMRFIELVKENAL